MRTLQPPTSINFDSFVVTWDPADDVYVLSLPDGTTYELGNAEDAFLYFRRVGIEEMGQRGIDCARNFYTAIVAWKEKRCFGAETKESRSDYNRLFREAKEDTIIA